MAVQQGQDAGRLGVGEQERDLVPEPAQAIPAARAAACGEDLDRFRPAITGRRAPHLAVAARAERLLSGDHPLAISLACTDCCHGR